MERKRGLSSKHKKKKKKRPQTKFGKQMGKKWKDFNKGLREMGEKMKGGRTRHGQENSGENIQLGPTSTQQQHFRKTTIDTPLQPQLEPQLEPPSYNIQGGIKRQQSSPQPYTHRMSRDKGRNNHHFHSNDRVIRDSDDIGGVGTIDIDSEIDKIYLRKQLSDRNQGGSLTDGDEPFEHNQMQMDNLDPTPKVSDVGYHSTPNMATVNRNVNGHTTNTPKKT